MWAKLRATVRWTPWRDISARRAFVRAAHIAVCGFSFCTAMAAYANGPDTFSYQIQFPASPTSGADALASFDSRAQPMLASMACGSDVQYALNQNTANEDMTGLLIAKLEWAAGHPDGQGQRRISGPCTFLRYFGASDLCNQLSLNNCQTGASQALKDAFRTDFVRKYFPSACFFQSTVQLVTLSETRALRSPVASNGPGIVAIQFTEQPECLIAQINSSLLAMRKFEQMGTSGAPCFFFGKSTGEWDFSVRNLTRLAYLNARYHDRVQMPLISAAALKWMEEQLLTADGAPAQEKYSFAGCGNTEESTGSSQDRADERDWTDQPFWQSVGDFLWGLFKLFVIIVLAYLFALAFIVLLGTGVVGALIALGATAAAVAAVILLGGQIIPETENHLLQINTSKYLRNQMILVDVPGDSDGANRYRKDQSAVRDWLLVKMQSILKGD